MLAQCRLRTRTKSALTDEMGRENQECCQSRGRPMDRVDNRTGSELHRFRGGGDASAARAVIQPGLGATAIDERRIEGALERHFSVKEIADSWGLCENSVREIFKGEADVVRIQRPKSRWKRAYTTLRIPESVVERVHRRMSVVV